MIKESIVTIPSSEWNKVTPHPMILPDDSQILSVRSEFEHIILEYLEGCSDDLRSFKMEFAPKEVYLDKADRRFVGKVFLKDYNFHKTIMTHIYAFELYD